MCLCFKCSESLPHDTSDSDIPKLPHCEFVCLVDACALKNTNERQAAKSCAVSSQEITPHEKILLTNQ